MIQIKKLTQSSSKTFKYFLVIFLQIMFLFLILFFLNSPTLFAQTTSNVVQITSVGGASNVTEDFRRIYGGTTVSGLLPAASCNGSGLCNSCVDSAVGMRPCNASEVNDNTLLSIGFTWNGDNIAGTAFVGILRTTGDTTSPVILPTSISGLTKGASYTYSTQWRNICTALGCSGSCAGCAVAANLKSQSFLFGYKGSGGSGSDNTPDSDAKTVPVTLGFEYSASSPTVTECRDSAIGGTGFGACFFDIFPGDQKLFFDYLTYQAGFPGTTHDGLSFFYKPASTSVTDKTTLLSMNNLNAGDDFKVQNAEDKNFQLTGLENDTRYCVIIGTKSLAGNVSSFYPDNTTISNLTGAAETQNNQYCGVPREVFGVLDGKKCFIATAAFGSELNEHVERFRQFRNQFLLKSHAGKKLAMTYYKYSPDWAQWLDSNPTMKNIVRGFLWILLGFVELCFSLGLVPGTILFTALIVGGISGFIFSLRKVRFFLRKGARA